jgi:hypothetical protein
MADYSGMTVAEILKKKKASIKDAALEPGSPSWDEILSMTWGRDPEERQAQEAGFQDIQETARKSGV